jgi:sigma-B regulation protein RsbU (phosphoserine phosphatase)
VSRTADQNPKREGRDWKVGTKLIALTVPLIAIASLAAALAEYNRNQAGLKEKLTQRAKSIAHQIMADRQYYASTIVPRISELGGTMGPDYAQVHGRFPLPATFVREVSVMTAKIANGYTANLLSPWPINKEKGANDSFQKEGFAFLQTNPQAAFVRMDTVNGQAVMRVLLADIASAQSCVSCHNAHAQSPKHDFKLNDLMGGLEIVMPVQQYLQESRADLAMTLAGGTFMSLLVIAIVSFGTRRAITKPLAQLAARIAAFAARAGGRAEAPPHARARNEVVALADEFVSMQAVIERQQQELVAANTTLEQRVLERTEELRRTTAEKERIGSELRIASEIQRSILPRTFPPFPDREDFEIYAETIPAREMGGDFYDFFLIDESHLGFVIADVSDKGVPAAIFMAVSRSLIKATALKDVPPGECMRHVNSLLCPDNDSAMFVTVFYGVLDTQSGELLYSNAGHNLPYLLSTTGEIRTLGGTGGMALGVVDGISFETKRVTLHPGDSLFLYTDGITEALDAQGHFFSDDRLRRALQDVNGLSPTEMLHRVVADVRRFAEGAPQADDITVLALHYYGQPRNGEMAARDQLTVTLVNDQQEIQRLNESLEEFGRRHALPQPVLFALTLGLEETLMNVMTHGYLDAGEHDIVVRLALYDGEVRAEVEDDGFPFNPLEAPPPDLSQPLDQRPVGGLGIHLTRKMMDRVEYQRRGSKNVLIMHKQIAAREASEWTSQ